MRILSLIFISLFVTACDEEPKRDNPEQLLQSDVKEMANADAAQLLGRANAYLAQKDYLDAVELYSEIERLYPFSGEAILAAQNTAYAYFADDSYKKSIETIDNFLTLHPGSKHVPYMMYIKGMCYFDQMSDIKRDNEYAAKAREVFEKLVKRYPNAEYSAKAKEKLALAIDNMAGKEMEVGRYYLKEKNYVAAINRFKAVLEEYEGTNHYPEALYRMIEANLALGLSDRANRYYTDLSRYPNSSWYKKAARLAK